MDNSQKKQKLEDTINAISVREIRVSKTLISPQTGNSHTVELVAEITENDLPSSIIATHILSLKAETTALLHLSQSDGVPIEQRTESIRSLKSAYSILIASEMDNI